MCDVEKHIEQWRIDLTASDAFGGSDVDELESHLREEMERLTPLGLSETEAFLIARQRLGERPALETEYAKVNANRRSLVRLTWLAAGALLYVMAGYVVAGVSHGVMLAAAQLGVRGYYLGLVGVAAKIDAGVVLLLVGWALARRWSWSRFARGRRVLSPGRLFLLFVALVLLDCVLIGSQVLFNLMTARSLSSYEYARIAMVSGYASFGWTILAPILGAIVVLILWVRADRYQTTMPCNR